MLDIDLSTNIENVKTITVTKVEKCPKCESKNYDIKTIDSSITGDCLKCGNRFFLGMFSSLFTMSPRETEDFMKAADAGKEWSGYDY